ncbi:MAG: hypothetical protein L7U23_09755 [Crocinitomicaceae bacterium]|nr:hypothetical protein [Crocinitomicaceae bacterium]
MRTFVSIFALLCLLYSCSEDKVVSNKIISNADWIQKGTRFCSNSNEILAFGAVNIKQLLNKGIYNSELGQSGILPLGMIDDYKDALFTELPLYYTIHANSALTMLPSISILARHKNREQLIKTIKKDLTINKSITKGDVEVLFFDNFTIGIGLNNTIFILHDRISELKKIKLIQDSFKSIDIERQDNAVTEILSASKDITISLNAGYIQDLVLKILNQSEGTASSFDSKVALHLSFENGKIEIQNKNYLNNEMLSWNLFGSNSKRLIAKLGAGSPVAALLANVNVSELERLKNNYFEDGISNTLQNTNIDQIFLGLIPNELSVIEALISKDGINSYFDGNIALGAYSSDQIHTEYSGFVGIGSSLADIIKLEIKPFIGLLASTNITDSTFSIYTSELNGPQNKSAPLKLPKGTESLGNAPISCFMDFDRFPLKDLFMAEAIPLIDLLSIGTFNANMTNSQLTLYMNDSQTNSLTQICNSIPSLLIRLAFS